MDAPRPERLNDAEIAERIRRAGLRATRPRISTYRVLADTSGHLSVDDIVRRLRGRDDATPRMSVYNVVTDLADVGLVMRADTGPGRALYEVAADWHHHFVCRTCGAIFDVPCVVGSKPCIESLFDGGEVDEAQVIFRGRCNACCGKRSRPSA